MTKIIAVGDVHGRDFWQKVAKVEHDFDQFIFIGDYFDSFTISPEKQQDNFMDICDFKLKKLDKVTLLLGNHDMHYLPQATQSCSGWKKENHLRMKELLGRLVDTDLIKLCHQVDNVIFSHAGISKTWLNKTGIWEEDSNTVVTDYINSKLKTNPELFEFQKEDKTGYGEHKGQSPIWIRPESLRKDVGKHFVQVVGHTATDRITLVDDSIILIDSPKSKEYLIIEEGKIKPKKLVWEKRKENTG